MASSHACDLAITLGAWCGNALREGLIYKRYVAVSGYDAKRKTWGPSYLSRLHREQVEAGVLKTLDAAADQFVGMGVPAAAAGGGNVEQLKDLANLYSQGLLTEDEFNAQKAKLLAQ